MTTIELARALAAHGETTDAIKAYSLSLEQADGTAPDAELEAAVYLFENGEDYRISYTTFQSLYNRGHFQEELFDLMVGAFYAPNLKPQEKMYRRNCKLLAQYPYLFQKDFLPFEDLPVKLFPYDDNGYLPFDVRENRFGAYINPNHPVISQHFFSNLENPVLATDIFSQYELEYLNDNVRKSEWVARENHVYLHYTDWATFCSYLQCLDLRKLVKEEKIVFLIGEEITLYPIDFKARFGIDYSQCTVKPIGIREVTRLIWHTQLSSHNGGDFFNEVFYGHPNLLIFTSVMFDSVIEEIKNIQTFLREGKKGAFGVGDEPGAVRQLWRLKDPTDKDVLVYIYLSRFNHCQKLDHTARIAPALFFQPHFSVMNYEIRSAPNGKASLSSPQYEMIRNSPMYQGFRYIKTFTPLRRPTTSHAATIKFMNYMCKELDNNVVVDVMRTTLLNRGYLIDWQDRLYQDSRLVRFEDGKLNPKATFTALAAFLDLPYTESMTFCSNENGINPESYAGNARGFDPVTVYRTYDEFANETERYFIEYFLRDVYETYGFGFHYYDGAPVDEARANALIDKFTTIDHYIRNSQRGIIEKSILETGGEITPALVEEMCDGLMAECRAGRLNMIRLLQRSLYFINCNGQPLRMMPMLELDPALLEQPLYH